MGNDERRRQVASDITVDFPEGTPTTLTIEQTIFFKDNVAIAHPNGNKSAPITALGSTVFFRKGHKPKDFGFPVAVRTGEEVITAAVLPTSDVYLGNDSHHAHAIAAMAVMARRWPQDCSVHQTWGFLLCLAQ